MPVIAVVLFSKLPPLQKIPPSSRPREAPSSSGRVTVIPAASPTTQSAKVKRIWPGVTTTLLSVLLHLKSNPNLQEDPRRMVGIMSENSEMCCFSDPKVTTSELPHCQIFNLQ